jgi:hypothetical protein
LIVQLVHKIEPSMQLAVLCYSRVFSSSEKHFVLPVYVEVVIRSLATGHTRGFVNRPPLVDLRVYELLEAIESDRDCSSSSQSAIGSSNSADNSDCSMWMAV